MFSNESIFIGIDPTAGKRPMTYAALDDRLRVVALAKGDLNEALAFVAGQRQALIAVSGPPRPNQKVMEKPHVRESLTPPPRPGRWSDFRLVEFLLRQHRIRSPKTPAQESACPTWMRRSFLVYHRLEGMGCRPYPGETPLQWVEVYPHASFSVLLGRRPFAKNTFEGRIQRQLVLYERNVDIRDAMRVFEEITRHHLLHGVLPLEHLYTPADLDALVAAYTAWLAVHEPHDTMLLGDPEEGQILLPTGALKSRY
jgi:hypothetical protein